MAEAKLDAPMLDDYGRRVKKFFRQMRCDERPDPALLTQHLLAFEALRKEAEQMWDMAAIELAQCVRACQRDHGALEKAVSDSTLVQNALAVKVLGDEES